MKNLETEIIIQASPATVWDVLTSNKEYPSWNPFIVEMKGTLAKGNTIQTTMMQKGKPQTFQPEILVFEPNRKFEWRGKMPLGMFNGHHYFHLEPNGERQTRLIHGEHFSGWLRPLIMALIGKETRRGFEAMNQALKNRIEGA